MPSINRDVILIELDYTRAQLSALQEEANRVNSEAIALSGAEFND